MGLASVGIEDIQRHNQSLLQQLNEHMQQVRAEDERRRALVAMNQSKEGGKRSSVNLCPTVVPLMGVKDEGTVKAIVQQAVEAHQNLGSKYEDPDFAPYTAKDNPTLPCPYLWPQLSPKDYAKSKPNTCVSPMIS